MHQLSFSSTEHAMKKRITRREKFLGEMERVVPWVRLVAVIEPVYPKSGRVGRPPIGVERMLRMYFLQQWYSLSDEGLEDAITDSQALRQFVRIDLSRQAVPDATTLLKFRRLLQAHDLTQALFAQINAHLSERGLLMREGTMIDATLIAAPSSTKNRTGTRDPEMHSTKKGNQWHFGMKAHIGADAESGLVHSLHTTPAHASDVAHTAELLHGEETQVFADAGYTGAPQRAEVVQAQTQGRMRPDVDWQIAQRRSTVNKLPQGPHKTLIQALERAKARVRARVEHAFHVLKNRFGHKKTRYKGLAKNTAQLYSLFGLVNLALAKNKLLNPQGTPAS